MKHLMQIAGGVVVLMSYSHIALATAAQPVDEPATMALLGMAAGVVVVARHLRNRKK